MLISDWSSDVCSSVLQGGRLQAQRLAGPGGKPAADDQRNPPAGPRFIEQHLRLELEFGNDLAILERAALVRTQLNDIAHIHFRDIELDGQRSRIFHRVVEDRGDLVAQAHTAEALVRSEEHTSELQSLMRISYAVFCLQKKKKPNKK